MDDKALIIGCTNDNIMALKAHLVHQTKNVEIVVLDNTRIEYPLPSVEPIALQNTLIRPCCFEDYKPSRHKHPNQRVKPLKRRNKVKRQSKK